MKQQRRQFLTVLALSSAASIATATPQFPEYSMVLVGGGLHTCSSQNQAACSVNPTFAIDAKATEQYALNLTRIRDISQSAVWSLSRAEQRQQTQAILSQLLLDFGTTAMTEHELRQRLRLAKVAMAGQTISGETLYQQLSELELNLVFDLLQQPLRAEQGQRQREQASLAQTQDLFSVEIYKKITELAAKIRQKPGKPVILVVTASGRDPFAAADFYQSVFAETGADARWLPLNAAYQAAQQQKTAGKASCDQLPQYLASIHGSYNRAAVYPDLFANLQALCQQGHAAAVAEIQQADAIFFNGGDQSLTLQALRLPDGSPSPELKAITTRLQAGKLLVAGTSAGTAVQAGGHFAEKPVPMISNGSSAQALQSGAVAAEAPLAGCEKNHSCPAAMAEDQLTYRAQGGLGLFPFGVLDTHFSERGREARLVRLLSDTQTRYGFGVDEATALLVGLDPAAPDNARFAVLGTSGVYIADLAGATAHGGAADWTISGVRSHYLSRDDQAMLHQGELTIQFAPWKQPVPRQPAAPTTLRSTDILSGDHYRQLALQLCQSGQNQAEGQASQTQLVLQQQPDSKAANGRYQHAGSSLDYCSYQNFYMNINH